MYPDRYRAAQPYLEQFDEQWLTRQIEAAMDLIGGVDDSAAAAVAAGRLRLSAADDDW